jgi:hypothetical protein
MVVYMIEREICKPVLKLDFTAHEYRWTEEGGLTLMLKLKQHL